MSSAAYADDSRFEPDFYLFFDQCNSLVTSRGDAAGGAVKEMPVKGYSDACQRGKKRAVRCVTDFVDGSKPKLRDATIEKETALGIIIATENYGDVIDINPSASTAVAETRIWSEQFFAVKLCHGRYLTADEAKSLEKKK